MSNNLQKRNDSNNTLIDVFNNFEKKVFSKLKASTLARFEAVTKEYSNTLGYGKVLVKPMPLLADQQEYSLEVYCIANMSSVTPGTVVPICFTDMDFRSSLENNVIAQDTTGLFHKQSYGVCLYQSGSGSSITIDTELSNTSRNPVENRIITQYLENIPGITTAVTDVKYDITGSNFVLQQTKNGESINIVQVDKNVQDGSLNLVTSNAVFQAINSLPSMAFDETPIERSTNAVRSNGIYYALLNKLDKDEGVTKVYYDITNGVIKQTINGVDTNIAFIGNTLTVEDGPNLASVNLVLHGITDVESNFNNEITNINLNHINLATNALTNIGYDSLNGNIYKVQNGVTSNFIIVDQKATQDSLNLITSNAVWDEVTLKEVYINGIKIEPTDKKITLSMDDKCVDGSSNFASSNSVFHATSYLYDLTATGLLNFLLTGTVSNINFMSISTNLTTVGNCALCENKQLTDVDFGNHITDIGSYAFSNCINLINCKSMINIQNINEFAFYNCGNCLYYDFSNANSIPNLMDIGTNIFYNINASCNIVVPDSLYDTWKETTNWTSINSHIINVSSFGG
jgi:hypothetical protein